LESCIHTTWNLAGNVRLAYSATSCVNNRFATRLRNSRFLSQSDIGPFNKLVTIRGASETDVLSRLRAFFGTRSLSDGSYVTRCAQRELEQVVSNLKTGGCFPGKWYYIDDGQLKRAPETWCCIIDRPATSSYNVEVLPSGHPGSGPKQGDVSFGVFATKDMPPRAVVGDYTPNGHTIVYLEKEATMNFESGAQTHIDSTVRVTGTNLIINSNKLTVSLTRLNHSTQGNNCKFYTLVRQDDPNHSPTKMRLLVVTTSNVTKGSELLLDYGSSFLEIRPIE